MLSDFSDPAYQEEQRQKEWDNFVEDLPVCSCCGRIIHPGNRIYKKCQTALCSRCMEDLEENEDIVEVD